MRLISITVAQMLYRAQCKGWRVVIVGGDGVMLSLTRRDRTFNIYIGYNGDLVNIPF